MLVYKQLCTLCTVVLLTQTYPIRSQTSADVLIIAEANNPLQYPTQGLEVRPLKTIIIPGTISFKLDFCTTVKVDVAKCSRDTDYDHSLMQ